MAEQTDGRHKPRRRTILGGRMFPEQGEKADCTIVDLSVSGARVRCKEAFETGTMITLKMERFGELRQTEVMWKRGDLYGLRFIGEMGRVPKSMVALFKLMKDSDGRR